MLVICPEWFNTWYLEVSSSPACNIARDLFRGVYKLVASDVSKSESQSCDRPRFGNLLNANDFVSIRKIYNFYEQIFRRVDLPYCAANVFYRHQSDK